MSNPSEMLRLRKALTYANGYRELSMFKEALGEIEALPEALRQREPAIQMQLAIHMDAKNWKKALVHAKRLYQDDPDNSGNAVNLAYVTRRAEGLEAAKSILAEACKRFPKEATIHYNLGCYACLEGNIEQAKASLMAAFALDKKFLESAAKDEDLAVLHPWVQEVQKEK